MIAVGFDFKAGFFDRGPVLKMMDRKTVRALTRFGAIVQREDKRSLKYGDKTSAPGTPPTVRRSKGFTRLKRNRKTGATTKQATSPLRELTFYAYDGARKSVVIGPELFRKAKGKDAARSLEEGGEAMILRDGKLTVAQIRPRPHTGPAFRRKLSEAPKGYGL